MYATLIIFALHSALSATRMGNSHYSTNDVHMLHMNIIHTERRHNSTMKAFATMEDRLLQMIAQYPASSSTSKLLCAELACLQQSRRRSKGQFSKYLERSRRQYELAANQVTNRRAAKQARQAIAINVTTNIEGRQ